MRLPVPGPRDVLGALERGADQIETLLGVVPRVLALLDAAGAAWVLADNPGVRVPLHVTGGWSYIRLHRGTLAGFPYSAEKLRRWAHRISSLETREVFVYFNNDPGGAAVRDAERLRRVLNRPRT